MELSAATVLLGRLHQARGRHVVPLRFERLHHAAAGPPSRQSKWALVGFRRRGGRVSTVDRARHGVSRTHGARGRHRPEFGTVAQSVHCRGHVVLPLVAIVS